MKPKNVERMKSSQALGHDLHYVCRDIYVGWDDDPQYLHGRHFA